MNDTEIIRVNDPDEDTTEPLSAEAQSITLRLLRELIAYVDDHAVPQELQDMADLFRDMDASLTAGGPLPEEWQRDTAKPSTDYDRCRHCGHEIARVDDGQWYATRSGTGKGCPANPRRGHQGS